MVEDGQITDQQTVDMLRRQATDGGRLGDLLVAAGHISPEQFVHCLSLQNRIVIAALVVALQLASISLGMPSAYAEHISAGMLVTVSVVANAKMQPDYQADWLVITEKDLARGYIDVPAGSRFSIITNDPLGYIVDFSPIGNVFESVNIQGFLGTVQLNADGGTVVQRSTTPAKMSHELNYHFILRQGTAPGDYPWPLMLSVRPLSGV